MAEKEWEKRERKSGRESERKSNERGENEEAKKKVILK